MTACVIMHNMIVKDEREKSMWRKIYAHHDMYLNDIYVAKIYQQNMRDEKQTQDEELGAAH
jgi:chorismate mutase